MNRNKIKFFYALYEGREELKDDYGNFTGEYAIKHSNPKEFYANVSAAKGEVQTLQFGDSESYDKVIVFDSDAPNIDEHSILWIDVVPELNEDGSTNTPHDYVVKEVAKSLNVTSIAISKVNVSGKESN